MKCSECGHVLPEDSVFCQYCGNKMIEKSIVPEKNINEFQLKISSAENTYDGEEQSCLREVKNVTISSSGSADKVEQKPGATEEERREQSVIAVMNDAVTPQCTTERTDARNGGGALNYKKTYCKKCGAEIDRNTKQCTGCGKQYFRARFRPVLSFVLLLILFYVGFLGYNYSQYIDALNNEQFIKAERYFDTIPFGKSLFAPQYEYLHAGILMEEGQYVDALYAFNKIENTSVPATITESLKAKIYSDGQMAYRAGNMSEASRNFKAISTYKRSSDYQLLINCGGSSFTNDSIIKTNYSKLVKLLGFEDVDKILLSTTSVAQLFLEGRWETVEGKRYYFEMSENKDGKLSCSYSLPWKDAPGYYYILDGVYSIGETKATAIKCFRFTIIDEDTISVYCFKDGSTHKLLRQ